MPLSQNPSYQPTQTMRQQAGNARTMQGVGGSAANPGGSQPAAQNVDNKLKGANAQKTMTAAQVRKQIREKRMAQNKQAQKARAAQQGQFQNVPGQGVRFVRQRTPQTVPSNPSYMRPTPSRLNYPQAAPQNGGGLIDPFTAQRKAYEQAQAQASAGVAPQPVAQPLPAPVPQPIARPMPSVPTSPTYLQSVSQYLQPVANTSAVDSRWPGLVI